MPCLNKPESHSEYTQEHQLPKTYAKLMPNYFSISHLLPPKHCDALAHILKAKKGVYGIMGGRGACKTSVMSAIGMFFTLRNEGDVIVICKNRQRCHYAMAYFEWCIERSGVKDRFNRYCSKRLFICNEHTEKECHIRFLCETDDEKLRNASFDWRVQCLLVDDAEDIDFGKISVAFLNTDSNTIIKRKIIASFHIREAKFFDGLFYDFIRMHTIFQFSYLDIPRHYLGENFFRDAGLYKKINPRGYNLEYLSTIPNKQNKPSDLSDMFKLYLFNN